jgi:3D (Asp-Asp-Asp) domain-containing protein
MARLEAHSAAGRPAHHEGGPRRPAAPACGFSPGRLLACTVLVCAAACSGGASFPSTEPVDHGTAGEQAEALVQAREERPRYRPPGRRLGRFDLTFYWIAEDRSHRTDDGDGELTELYDPSCTPLATVSREFAIRLSREGTGKLRDGRVLNAARPCECGFSPCFRVIEKHPWGVGVKNRPLAPFRSVAVDPRLVPIGSRLYVAELDGQPMPGADPWGNYVHDGCVIADDRGGNVRGRQLDFFTGRRRYYDLLRARGTPGRITVFTAPSRCAHL